jgi:hypothetical protein
MAIFKKHKTIDPELKRYVDYFVDMSMGKVKKKDLIGLTIGFYDSKDPTDKTVGMCHYFPYEIEIRRDFWYMISESKRYELMLHELGHCVLKREHTNLYKYNSLIDKLGLRKFFPPDKLKDGCPSSLMNSTMIDDICTSMHYNYYIDELFGRITAKEYDLILWSPDVRYIEISR